MRSFNPTNRNALGDSVDKTDLQICPQEEITDKHFINFCFIFFNSTHTKMDDVRNVRLLFVMCVAMFTTAYGQQVNT